MLNICRWILLVMLSLFIIFLCYHTFFKSGLLGVIKLIFLLFLVYMSLRSYLFIPIDYYYNALFYKDYTLYTSSLEDRLTMDYALEIFTNTETQLNILFYIFIYKLFKSAVHLYNKKK